MGHKRLCNPWTPPSPCDGEPPPLRGFREGDGEKKRRHRPMPRAPHVRTRQIRGPRPSVSSVWARELRHLVGRAARAAATCAIPTCVARSITVTAVDVSPDLAQTPSPSWMAAGAVRTSRACSPPCAAQHPGSARPGRRRARRACAMRRRSASRSTARSTSRTRIGKLVAPGPDVGA